MPNEAPLGAVTEIGHRAGAAGYVPETREEGYPLIDGPHYLDVLGALHEILAPEWYLEIGTNRGESLRRAPGSFVAVDPDFIFDSFRMEQRGAGHFFQQTSDDFFASDFLERTGIRPDLGFLDGLHLFEFLLRDVMNFERAAAPGAMAVLHDCLPFNRLMTERDWDQQKTRFWTGDVWKTLAILMRHRPDLTIDVLDAYPTGLVLIRGLNPSDTHLTSVYDDVVEEFRSIDLPTYGLDTYFGQFTIQSSFAAVQALRESARNGLKTTTET